MNRATQWFASAVYHLVLVCFLVQTLNPLSLGYSPPVASPPPITQSSTTSPLAKLLDFLIPAANAQEANLLASTPEADLTDRYLIDKANELGKDPQRIFAFVRDQIGFESYVGSLRGARGTLWSNAGNALDKASLLIGLLRVSGIPAQYVQGTLEKKQAQELIASMFLPAPYRVVGCLDENAILADPANNPELLNEAKQHFLVEFKSGSSFVVADPSFRNAQIGQTFADSQGKFAEMPDNLRHKITIRLKAELQSVLSEPETRTVLEKTLVTASLAGKPLTIGHFVNSDVSGGLISSSSVHTYSPYLLVGQNDSDIKDDEIFMGENYQEFGSNAFSLANQILSGLFVEIDVIDPNNQTKHYSRSIVDRVGFAARSGSSIIPAVNNVDVSKPALTEFDVMSVSVLPGLQAIEAILRQRDRLKLVHDELTAIQPQINALPSKGSLTLDQQDLLSKATKLTRYNSIISAETILMTYHGAADEALKQLQLGYQTKAYYNSPRLLISQMRVEDEKISVSLDISKNDIRALPIPGQAENIDFFFEIARGLIESQLEGEILSSLLGKPTNAAIDVFSNLPSGTNVFLLTKENISSKLDSLRLSPEAVARISKAINAGKLVITPETHGQVGGDKLIGWLEVDQNTGHTIAVHEDGRNLGIIEELGLFLNNRGKYLIAGISPGFSNGILIFVNEFLENFLNNEKPFEEIVKKAKNKVLISIVLIGVSLGLEKISEKKVVGIISGCLEIAYDAVSSQSLDPIFDPWQIGVCVAGAIVGNKIGEQNSRFFQIGVIAGMITAYAWLMRNIPGDPAVFEFLSTDLSPSIDFYPPGSSPNFNLQVVPDKFFTIPVGSKQLPSVYKALIQNQGPEMENFQISFPQVPSGYSLKSSVSKLMVPAGQIGEVGICLRPLNNSLAMPGTDVPFSVNVTDTNGITQTIPVNLTIPDVVGITLEGTPAQNITTPSGTVNATLTVKSTGNVAAQNVPLTLETSNGLTVTGLPASVSLDKGQSKAYPITLTPAADAALNSTLTATVTASFGRDLDGNPFKATTAISLDIRSPQVAALEKANLTVAQLVASGKADPVLSQTLSTITTLLAQWQAKPDDTRLAEQLNIELENAQILFAGIPELSSLVAEFQTLQQAAANHDLNAFLSQAESIFSDLETQAANFTDYDFSISLIPNNVELLPGGRGELKLRLENRGAKPVTLNLTTDTLPAGVNATFTPSQVVLAPGEVRDATSANPVVLTLEQTATQTTTAVFPLHVVATVAEATDWTRTALAHITLRSTTADVISVMVTPNVVNSGPDINLVQALSGVTTNVSSSYPGSGPERAIDGDRNTSWFTAQGDAANLGQSPFYEVILPQDAVVNELNMFGNREYADGYDFFSGIFELFDKDGKVLFNSGTVALPAPNRDLTLLVDNIRNVRRIRFTATADESMEPGFAELEVIGYLPSISEPITVQAKILNSANIARAALARLEVFNQSGTAVTT